MHARASAYFHELQDRVCSALERIDGIGRFREDVWDREGGGGGRTRVLAEGAVFEKAGVNCSDVFGELSEEFSRQLPGDGRSFSASGVSIVIHPRNPFVPTVHANLRFLTHGARQWFGGGSDLTPYYPFRDDVIHFHKAWRAACDRHKAVADYRRFKEECDRYFYLPHRGEARGVGGIFFDYLDEHAEATFAFVRDCGDSLLEAYSPIVQRRKDLPFGERERRFQLLRRGRYAEFNLIYDRGTLFGLKTGGRIESILMSLPPLVGWEYDSRPEPETREAELLEVYLKPRDWAGEDA